MASHTAGRKPLSILASRPSTMIPEVRGHDANGGRCQEAKRSVRIICWMVAILIVPATLTLRRVIDPGTLHLASPNPTPLGYTWSLSLFLVPLLVLGGWFLRRRDLVLARPAFLRTMVLLVPSGFGLDLLFGNRFFTFPNPGATLGIGIPSVGGPLPVEEFVFYLTGFMLVLLSYIWADEFWMRAYNVPDYRAQAREVRRIAQFHPTSAVVGVAILAVAVVYKKQFSNAPEGFPWYLTYLIAASFIPAAGFLRTTQPFVNWRAFSITFFFTLLISLLWEATLAVPFGWWDYRPSAMMGLTIGAWRGLPLEAVAVWMAVTFTTVIVYEVVKIWLALGVGASQAFFGIRPR